MSKLYIKFDDAKEVIKDILEQFYGLKEDTNENEFENTIEYLFQELEQKCFYPTSDPTSDPIDFELKVLKQVVLKVNEYKEFLAKHPDSISKDYLHAVRDLTNDLDEILRGDDNE